MPQQASAAELDSTEQEHAPEDPEKPLRRRRPRPLVDSNEEIPRGEEALLTSYFSSLGSAFERSVFGAILERQQESSATSRKCARCQGHGIVDGEGGFALVEQAIAQEKRDPERGRPIFDATVTLEVERFESTATDAGKWCARCNGTGCIDVEHVGRIHTRCEACAMSPRVRTARLVADLARAAEPYWKGDDSLGRLGPAERQRHYFSRSRLRRAQCCECLGSGVPLLTADIGQASKQGGGVIPDDTALGMFAICSRRLGRVRARGAVLADALRAFYGDVGARWALVAQRGRLFALFSLTPSGRRLARIAQKAVAKDAKPLTKKQAAAKLRWKNPEPLPVHQFGRRKRRARLHSRRVVALEDKPTWIVSGRAQDPALARKRNYVEELRESYDSDLPAHERIGWAAALVNVPAEWRQLLASARVEALDLYSRAVVAWNRAGGLRKRELAAVVRLVERAESDGLDAAADYIRRHAGAR